MIAIDRYSGAYGPTLRIDVSSSEELLLLRRMLEELAVTEQA
jgi:hypothetical protein